MRIALKGFAAAILCLSANSVSGEVNVDGAGNVGVGKMLGGTIQVGLTGKDADAIAKAVANSTGDELVQKLTPIIQGIVAQRGDKNREDSISIGVVEGFLATIKGKQIPRSEWPQTFGDLTRQYLEAGARISAIPVTTDEIKGLVAQADAARKLGKLDDADRLLNQATDLAIHDAQTLKQQAQASSRQAAGLLASRASLAFTQLSWAKGAGLLEAAFEQRKDDPSLETATWLGEAGDAWTTVGNSAAAMGDYTHSHAVVSTQAAANPSNAEWQRLLAVSDERIGNTVRAQGDLSGALKSYQASLVIRQKLAAADSSNAGWQHDLAISNDNAGDILIAQGDLAGALKCYQASLAIRQKLAAADLSNASWQRDLAASDDRIGYTLRAQGDLNGALKSYQACLAIAQKLTAADPSNTLWQRDLAISDDRIGDILRVQSNLSGALKAYQESLAIRQKLVTADPSNTDWRRDLSISNNKIGDTLRAQGDLSGALTSYQLGLAIRQKLVASDPSNAIWQRDLSVSGNKIGDTLRAQGDLSGALKSYQASLAIAQKLTAADPSNTGWQSDIAEGDDRIGETLSEQGDIGGALKSYRASLSIRQKVAAIDPSNTQWQVDVVVSLWDMGTIDAPTNSKAARTESLSEGLRLMSKLQQDGVWPSSKDAWPGMFRQSLDNLR